MKHNDGNISDKTCYDGICRLVDISMLATFIRDFPLNNLNEEERKKILEFERYVIELENRIFSDLGVY